MADKHDNPFTSLPPFSEANPFLPLAPENPFFQELHSAAPLTPDVPSLFSSQSGGNATPDLLRIGNKQGPSQMDISFDPLISHFERQTEKDEFEHFAKDRLKPSDEVNETKDSVTPPALLLKTNNQEPSGALGGLMVSDTNDLTDLGQTASAGTVEASKETAAEIPQVSGSDVNDVCSSSDEPDLTDHGAHGCPEFDMNLSEVSLPENSSLEFSELNTLACPYPTLSSRFMNEDSSDATSLEDHPKMSINSQNAKSDLKQPSLSEADTVDLLPGICFEFSEGVSVNPETSQRPEALESATDIESVIVHEDPMPFCRDNSSGDTLEQSTVISDSLGGDPDHQSIEPCHSPQSDIIPGNIIQSDEEFWRSNAFLIQTVAVSGKSLVETTEPSRIHVQSAQSSLVSAALPVKNEEKADAVMDTMLQNESGDGLLEGVSSKDICSEIEDSVPENIFDGSSSPRLSKIMSKDMQEDKQKVSELPTSPCKNDLMGNLLESISEEQEIMHSNGPAHPEGHLLPTTGIRIGTHEDASDPNSVLSPGSVLIHSLYKSAESDQYLTCVSQQDSISPSLELTQDVKPKCDWSVEKFESLPNQISHAMPKDDTSVKAVPEMACKQNQVIEDNIKPSQEVLPKPEFSQESPLDVSQRNCLLDLLPETHTFTQKSAPSHNTSSENIMFDMIKSDFNEAILQHNPSGDIVEKNDFSKDMMPIVITSDMIAELEAQLAPLDRETCLVNDCKTCPTKQNDSQKVQKDESHNIESFGIVSEGNLHLAQLTEPNVFLSDCTLDQTSSITQDLVITDSDLKNIFLPQPTETHLVCTSRSSVANPESAENLDRNIEMWTTPAIHDSETPDLFPVNWPPLPHPSAPSLFDQPKLASRHDRSLNFTSLFDLSPLASSTPHVAVDTNAFPQLFPFPKIPPTSVESLPRPELAAPLPTMQPTTSYNPFLQDKTRPFDHQGR